MARSVFVVWNDKYHLKETYAPAINAIFGGDTWDLAVSESARSLLKTENSPDLAIFLAAGLAEGEDALSAGEQAAICRMVEAGMGALFIHAGLTRILPDTPMYELTRGYFIMHPEGNPPIYCCAQAGGPAHPAMCGIGAFEAPDEHYFCFVDAEHTNVFLFSRSAAGTEIAGWAHERDGGRVCCLSPGHTAQMTDILKPLIVNAASWCVKDT